jgi:histidinol-phosphate/aromatic aminotransferase/cobyric acid decarboxylase-like protein
VLALDGSVSPYLPTKEILAAIENDAELEHSPATLARMLRERLSLLLSVSPDRIALYPQNERRLERLAALRPGAPWVVYPPVSTALGVETLLADTFQVERSHRFRIETDQIAATPRDSTALVMTPNDPTGNALSVTSAAQLGRRCGLLVLDERSAEMQRRSMIPLVEEFDSIVLLRSFSDWAGLGANAPGYAITTQRIAAAIDRSDELEPCGLRAALAAVSSASQLDAIAYRVRLERMRLYRMLRKLNFVAPLPSDAGFVLAEVTRGERDEIARALADREIAVYAPQQDRLKHTLRFSAISPAATKSLQCALIDISRTMLD